MIVRRLSCRRRSSSLLVLLALVTAISPVAVVVGEQPIGSATSDKTHLATPDAGKLDLSFVSPRTMVIAVVRPQALLKSPVAALFAGGTRVCHCARVLGV